MYDNDDIFENCDRCGGEFYRCDLDDDWLCEECAAEVAAELEAEL